MIKLLVPAVVGVVTFTFAPLPAQEKASNTEQTASYRFAVQGETLTNGDAVTITRKAGAAKVSGVFVYADPKTGRLFVRPQPGQAPIAVASTDVDKIDRIAPAGGADKSGIRFAHEGGVRPAHAYEIQELRGYNGPYPSVYFYDAALSPREHEQLAAIEQASADVVAKGLRVDALRRNIQEAVAERTTPTVPVIYAPYLAPDPYSFFAYPGTSELLGINGRPSVTTSYSVIGLAPNLPVVPMPAVEIQPPVRENVAKLTASLSEAEAALQTARKNYDAARNRAIYEPGGQIVAVRLGD